MTLSVCLLVLSLSSVSHGAIVNDHFDLHPAEAPPASTAPAASASPPAAPDGFGAPTEAEIAAGAMMVPFGKGRPAMRVDVAGKPSSQVAEEVAALDMKVASEELKLDCMAGCAKKKSLDIAANEAAKEEDKEAGANVAHQFIAQQERAKTELEIDEKKVITENTALEHDKKRVEDERKVANKAVAEREDLAEKEEKEKRDKDAATEKARVDNDAAVAKAKDDAGKADENKLDQTKDDEKKKVLAQKEAKNAKDLELVSKTAAEKAGILAPP